MSDLLEAVDSVMSSGMLNAAVSYLKKSLRDLRFWGSFCSPWSLYSVVDQSLFSVLLQMTMVHTIGTSRVEQFSVKHRLQVQLTFSLQRMQLPLALLVSLSFCFDVFALYNGSCHIVLRPKSWVEVSDWSYSFSSVKTVGF